MSHAHGKVKFEDGTVLCYEYNGTVDLTCTALRRTHEEVSKHWRADNMAECTCGAAPEKVRIMTDYGDGSSWDGTACRKCMAITGGINPDDAEDTYEDGIPDWANDQADRCGGMKP